MLQLEPSILWKHFYELTQIPRPSHHEEAVIKYIESFAERKKLKFHIDEVGNVLVSKPATSGMEKLPGVILQSHVDMVPQKNSNKKHNFEIDPIETFIEGEWLTANDTTLGADNGIGCAAMLAVLDSDNIKHGPLEALFTINEEAGMEGAFGLKTGLLKGNILINLDSEEESQLFIGCAGGLNAEAVTTYTTTEASGITYEITISGLKGGHSGVDIHLGRGNSNKLLGRLLWSAMENLSIKIASVDGGDLRNAIPREAKACVVLDEKYSSDFELFISSFNEIIQTELGAVEPSVVIEAQKLENAVMVLCENDALRIVGCMNAAPNGIIRMSDAMPGIPETSLNLAIVKVDGGKAEFFYLIRSFLESAKYALGEQVAALHKINNFTLEFTGDYPGWRPNQKSHILKVCEKTFEGQYGKHPEKLAMHAGLECGIIGGKYPQMDMISFGPTIRFPHSPDEKVHIKSVDNFYAYLIKVLEQV